MDAAVREGVSGQHAAPPTHPLMQTFGIALVAAAVTALLMVLPLAVAVHGLVALELFTWRRMRVLLVFAAGVALIGLSLVARSSPRITEASTASLGNLALLLPDASRTALKVLGACAGSLILGTLVFGWNGFFPTLMAGAVAAAVWGWPLWWLWRTGKPAAALRAVRTRPGWSSLMFRLFPSRVHVVRLVAVLVVAIGCWHYFLRDRLADYGEDNGATSPALYILAEAISGRDAPCSYIPRDRRERIHCDRMMAVNRSFAAGKADIATRSREIAGIRYHLADSPGGTAVLDEYIRRLAERP